MMKTDKYILMWDTNSVHTKPITCYAMEDDEEHIRNLPSDTPFDINDVIKNIRIIPPGTPILSLDEFLQKQE